MPYLLPVGGFPDHLEAVGRAQPARQQAEPEQGRWTLCFEIKGPPAAAPGTLPITLLPRPGPPVLLGGFPCYWSPAVCWQ